MKQYQVTVWKDKQGKYWYTAWVRKVFFLWRSRWIQLTPIMQPSYEDAEDLFYKYEYTL